MDQAGRGKLSIHPISAKLIRDTVTFGSMNPYCKIFIGGQNKKTRIADGGGKLPKWADWLDFVKGNEDVITIEVWSYSLAFSDDLVGTATIPLARLLSTPVFEDNIEIIHKGKKAGEIRINSRFTPDSNQTVQVAAFTPVAGYPTYQGYPQAGLPPQPAPGYSSVTNYPPQPGYPSYQTYSQPGYPQAYPAQPYPSQPVYGSQPVYPPQPGYPRNGYS